MAVMPPQSQPGGQNLANQPSPPFIGTQRPSNTAIPSLVLWVTNYYILLNCVSYDVPPLRSIGTESINVEPCTRTGSLPRAGALFRPARV